MNAHTHTHGQISSPGFEVETAVVAAVVVVLAVVALGSSFNTFTKVTGNIPSLPPIFPLIQSSLTHPVVIMMSPGLKLSSPGFSATNS